MRSGVPWSVKGIEPEAREAAKQAARRAGVTLGAWLNQVIMDGGTDEVGLPDSGVSYRTSDGPVPSQNNTTSEQTNKSVAVDLAPVAEAVRDVVSRVEQSERRTQDLARRMEQSVNLLAERLDESERHMDEAVPPSNTFDPLERKIQQLSERLEAAENGRGGRRGADDRAQLQSLEKAVNAVVDHLETAERRTDDALADIRRTLNNVAERVDEHEEEGERAEAEARARAAEEHMRALAARLEKMESSVSGVGPQAVDAALKAIADRDDEERNKATITQLQQHLSEISHRLERAEKRTDETLKTFELTVAGITRRLEEANTAGDAQNVHEFEIRAHEADQRVHEVEARLEDVSARLHQSEEMSLQAAQTIERAIAGMSDSLNQTENRSRDTIDNLNVMLERMTDRLGRIERETKATRSSLKQTVASGALSPQIHVGGAQGGAGFVPDGPAFPIPNFDAPSIGGSYEPLAAEFRSPAPKTPAAPVVTPEHTFESETPPPPFSGEMEDGRREPRIDVRRAMTDEIDDYDDDDGVVVDEPKITAEPARAANDFMAAARRAAQAAAQNGRNGPQPGASADGHSGAYAPRYAALDDGEGRRKKFIFAGLAAIIIVAIVVGAMRLLSNEPVIVTTTHTPDTRNSEHALPDMGASTETTKPSAAVTTVPAGPSHPEATVQSHPEATPEDAGAAQKAASASATATQIVPVAKPASAPRHNTVTQGPAIVPGPSATPAPSKPVESTPLASSNAPSSPDRALRSAAVAGNAAAQYEVGQRYANGENVPQDLAQAAYWYNQAADQGLAIAQYRLAALYEKGRGVAKDDGKARDWYEKAATKGNVKAMHNLAVIYAEGRGTRQDFTTAAHWFDKAAGFGLGDSQYNLAILEERGLGVPQDLVLAYKWLAIAAKGGDKGAAQKRDEIAARLDPAKLAQAKVAVQTWSAKRPDPVANGDLSGMGSWAAASGGGDATASIQTSEASARNKIGLAQTMLIKLGYNPGSSDGLMGPRTHDAILAYQRSAGLDQTGNVNPTLLKSLEIATR